VDKNRRPPYCCSCLRCCSYHFPLSRYCQGYTALIATLLTPLLERFSLNWKHFRRVGGRGAGQYHGVDTVHTYLINVTIILVETLFYEISQNPCRVFYRAISSVSPLAPRSFSPFGAILGAWRTGIAIVSQNACMYRLWLIDSNQSRDYCTYDAYIGTDLNFFFLFSLLGYQITFRHHF